MLALEIHDASQNKNLIVIIMLEENGTFILLKTPKILPMTWRNKDGTELDVHHSHAERCSKHWVKSSMVSSSVFCLHRNVNKRYVAVLTQLTVHWICHWIWSPPTNSIQNRFFYVLNWDYTYSKYQKFEQHSKCQNIS